MRKILVSLIPGVVASLVACGPKPGPAPIVLLDVPLDSRAEREFVAALIEQSPEALATVPDGDPFARALASAICAMSRGVSQTP